MTADLPRSCRVHGDDDASRDSISSVVKVTAERVDSCDQRTIGIGMAPIHTVCTDSVTGI